MWTQIAAIGAGKSCKSKRMNQFSVPSNTTTTTSAPVLSRFHYILGSVCICSVITAIAFRRRSLVSFRVVPLSWRVAEHFGGHTNGPVAVPWHHRHTPLTASPANPLRTAASTGELRVGRHDWTVWWAIDYVVVVERLTVDNLAKGIRHQQRKWSRSF